MTLVDTFLFAEPYESSLLLTKLHLEAGAVNEFVLVESDVTFRGDFKGLHARKLIESDSRFAPFKERITIIEQRGRVFNGPPGYQSYYENEERSRQLAWDHINAKYDDDAWVFVSDVDEALDTTDGARLSSFFSHLISQDSSSATLYFGHYRYWYDFDNRCYWTGICTPVTKVGSIRSGRSSMRCRSRGVFNRIDVPPGDNPLFFEYTFCFPADAQWKKLNSFIHDSYAKPELENALLANHWVKAASRGERVGDRGREDWFEKVELTPQNSPAYVRDNLKALKTHVIPENYRENRKALYGV